MLSRLCRWGVYGRCVAAGMLLGAVGAFAYFAETPCTLPERCLPLEPLEVGLNADRQAIVQALIDHAPMRTPAFSGKIAA